MPSSEPLEMTMETFSILAAVIDPPSFGDAGSDAAARLGDSGDLRRGLGWSLGEELVKLFDRHAGGLAEYPDRWPRAFVLVFVPHELDDLPVPFGEFGDSFGAGDLGRHVLGPLAGVDKESLVTDIDGSACIGRGGHDFAFRGYRAGSRAE